MSKILHATCIDGNLVLSAPLDPSLEGKQLNLMILEEPIAPELLEVNEPTHPPTPETTEPNSAKLRAFLKWSKRYSSQFPPSSKVDRSKVVALPDSERD